MVRSCDIRGGGPGIDPFVGNAYQGGGLYVGNAGSTGAFYDVVFSNHNAAWGAIIDVYEQAEAHFFGCKFLDSAANSNGVGCVYMGFPNVKGSFSDWCVPQRPSRLT